MAIDTADFDEPFDPEDLPPATSDGWLSDDELSFVRERMPIIYVEAIPVRVSGDGTITEVGLLLRSTPDGVMNRAFVSGRVRFGESLKHALQRHLENDLGPMAFPTLPINPVPMQVAEYFPAPGSGEFFDERQHAIALVYVVPVAGTCDPRQDALEVTWMKPEVALSAEVLRELTGGRGRLLARALATLGC